MIAPIQPSPQYDVNNEAQFRTQVRQSINASLKNNEAISSFFMTDEADGKSYRVTLSGGVFAFAEQTP